MNKFRAFTIAELLIVIAMIGVIAALTLSEITGDATSSEYVAKFKKMEASVQNALNLAKIKYGNDISVWGDSSTVAKRIFETLNWESSCGLAVNSMCFSKSDIRAISGSETIDGIGNSDTAYKVVLKDNVSIAFEMVTDSDTGQFQELKVYTDLDGPQKGFNTMGQDIFILNVNESGMIVYDTIDSDTEETCRTLPANGDKCSALVHKNGNNKYIDG